MCCTGANDIIISAMTDKTIAHIKNLINVLFFFFLIGIVGPWVLYGIKTGDEYAGACDNN